MRIAIYTGIFPAELNETYNLFTVETIKLVIASHKEHEFILLSDKPDQDFISSHSHCRWTYLQAPPDNILLLKWWLSITIRGVLKKTKIELFVSPFLIATKSKIPQCFLVSGLPHLQYPEIFTKTSLFFFKHYIKKFLGNAETVIASSVHLKKIITDNYNIAAKKINVLPFSVNRNKPASKKKTGIAEKIAGDRIFFLAIAEQHITHELLNLLKAFSVFKKMQQSSMRLVISGKVNNDFQEQLNNYKYREDVILHLPSSSEDEKELIVAAYAVLLPSGFDDAGIYCTKAIQLGVPIVCMTDTASAQIAGNAALSFTKDNVSELASCMMELYKDENGRKKLIEKGKPAAEKLNAEKPEILLWQAIEKAMG